MAASRMRHSKLRIQIAYVRDTGEVYLEEHCYPVGQSVRHAILDSGLLKRCPEIDMTVNRVGIFGRLCHVDSVLEDGDRIEIYRPLHEDPKAMRRKRARLQVAWRPARRQGSARSTVA